MSKEINYLKTFIGILKITVKDTQLISINYLKKINDPEIYKPNSKTMKKVISQLNEYFNKNRKQFDIPLELSGTQFQRNIYKTLSKVDYGKSISYKELAEKSGHPKAYQAVGTALKKNKIGIIIPCHRVIKSDGKLGNYSGGKWRKEKLLKLENYI